MRTLFPVNPVSNAYLGFLFDSELKICSIVYDNRIMNVFYRLQHFYKDVIVLGKHYIFWGTIAILLLENELAYNVQRIFTGKSEVILLTHLFWNELMNTNKKMRRSLATGQIETDTAHYTQILCCFSLLVDWSFEYMPSTFSCSLHYEMYRLYKLCLWLTYNSCNRDVIYS